MANKKMRGILDSNSLQDIKASTIPYTRSDGGESDVQTVLDEQKTAISKIEPHYVVTTYVSSTLMRGYVYCGGDVNVAAGTVRVVGGTPYQKVKGMAFEPKFGGDPTRLELYIYGDGFVQGNVLGVDVIVFLK